VSELALQARLGAVGFEGAGGDPARCLYLFGRCFGADERHDADECHGEKGCEVAEVGVFVDVSRVLSVREGVVEGPGESLEISLDVLRGAGIEGRPLDCGVAEEASPATYPTFARVGVAGERLAEDVPVKPCRRNNSTARSRSSVRSYCFTPLINAPKVSLDPR
jgi:hypothetical protein